MRRRLTLRLALPALLVLALAWPAAAVAEDPPFVGWSALLPGASIPHAPHRPHAPVAEDPPFVGWSALLPGLSIPYDTTSPNDCVAGRVQCVDQAVREMTKRLDP